MHVGDAVMLGIFLAVLVVALTVAGYRLNKGYGAVSALIWFVISLVLGIIGIFLLFMLYASLYYAGGGH